MSDLWGLTLASFSSQNPSGREHPKSNLMQTQDGSPRGQTVVNNAEKLVGEEQLK